MDAGQRVGTYQVEGWLGEGRMASVYRVRDTELGRHLAMKVLDRPLYERPVARRRFLDEARTHAAQLDHPGIVQVVDVVETPEIAARISELVEGPTLAAVIDRRAPPDVRAVTALLHPIIAAVGAAHARGILHLGLAPSNVLLARGPGGWVPRVPDFGVAQIGVDAGHDPGKWADLPEPYPLGIGYTSPEQLGRRAYVTRRSDQAVTLRSDIYSLGALAYALAAGVEPFDADDDLERIQMILGGRHRPLRERRPELPSLLCAAIERAMALAPEDRFASCEALAAAL